MISTIKLVNTSITSHCYNFCGENLKNLLFKQLEIHNTVWLTIIYMLCVILPEITVLKLEVFTF